MTRNDATDRAGREETGGVWVIGIPTDRSGWLPIKTGPGLPPFDMQVRLGYSPSGRLFVTGLRIGAPDGRPTYEIKSLRNIHLGKILAQIREAAALDNGRALGPDLLGNAQPATMTIRRGPIPDSEADRRILETYEAKLASGLSKTQAVQATADDHYYVSTSQIYRRLARARSARQKEANEGDNAGQEQGERR